jgi:hypothetical protein
MMHNTSQSDRIVDRAVDKLNEVLLEEQLLSKDPDTIIFGADSLLDSMGFINFVVALEEAIEAETGLVVNVAEQIKEISEHRLRTLRDMSSLVSELIAEKKA